MAYIILIIYIYVCEIEAVLVCNRSEPIPITRPSNRLQREGGWEHPMCSGYGTTFGSFIL